MSARPVRAAVLALASVALLLASGCPSPVAPPPGSFGDTYTGSEPEVLHVPATAGYTFTYSLDLGTAARDVYFVFTNTTTATRANPTVQNLGVARSLGSGTEQARDFAVSPALPPGVAIRGMPHISAFNADPSAFLPLTATSRGLVLPPPTPQLDLVGDPEDFKHESATVGLIPATCKKVVEDAGENRILNIWVANDCWDGAGVKQHEVTVDMVDALGGKFLDPLSADDIYRWVSNIYGAEWGAHADPTLIVSPLPAAPQEVTILLYDIGGDGDVGDPAVNGGVAGFFYSKDNYLASVVSYSNERIMFYIDAVMFAMADGTPATWSIADYWPSEIVATLAHEFQHMVNFYQKYVLRTRPSGTETWINEMLSMATEDIVADKMGVPGPRGVLDVDTTGSTANLAGWLPLYNYFNDFQVAYWPLPSATFPDPYRSYAINYALGAFLARNYGGAAGAATFLRDVVWNSRTDYRALEYAASQGGSTDSFALMLQKWGAAVLLSEGVNPLPGYVYNTGTRLGSTLNLIDYKLGPINLYSYRYYYDVGVSDFHDGPYLYYDTDAVIGYSGGQLPTSNLYYEVGKELTGLVERDVYMGSGVKLTVVVK